MIANESEHVITFCLRAEAKETNPSKANVSGFVFPSWRLFLEIWLCLKGLVTCFPSFWLSPKVLFSAFSSSLENTVFNYWHLPPSVNVFVGWLHNHSFEICLSAFLCCHSMEVLQIPQPLAMTALGGAGVGWGNADCTG